MTIIFCDKAGRPIFWAAEDNVRLLDERGKTHGYVEGPHVFDLRGNHKGWYLDGVLRDLDGRVLGFWSGLTATPASCPTLPVLMMPFPNTPMSEVAPTPPVYSTTHIQPQLHMEWSAINPLEWLG